MAYHLFPLGHFQGDHHAITLISLARRVAQAPSCMMLADDIDPFRLEILQASLYTRPDHLITTDTQA